MAARGLTRGAGSGHGTSGRHRLCAGLPLRGLLLVLPLVLLLASTRHAAGQERTAFPAGPVGGMHFAIGETVPLMGVATGPAWSGSPASGTSPQEDPSGPRRWQVVLSSALLPGTGQLIQGQRRGMLYLLAEGLVWIGFNWERDRAISQRGSYRSLAWEVARSGAGSPSDGNFEYYERLNRWERSGGFDTDPLAPGIQPETDPGSFNGDAWRLASNIFLGGGPGTPGTPAYAEALAYYQERAYEGAFLWDWGNTGNAWGTYRFLVRESDRHFERASLILGGALLTRAVSTLDAWLSTASRDRATVRLEAGPAMQGQGGAHANGLLPAAYLVFSLRSS